MIPLKDQEIIRQKFAQELRRPVKIDLFTQREVDLFIPGRPQCPTCKPTREMLQELAALSDLLSLRVHILEEAQEEARRMGIERIPGILLRGSDGARLKFYGLPGGMEFPGFVESIVDLSRGESLLSPESQRALRKVKKDITVRVFVTPTCPYCPQMARAAYHLALANPRIHPEVIQAGEFPDLAQRYGVKAVPLTIIDDRVAIPGAVPERGLVEQVVKAAQGAVSGPGQESGPTSLAQTAQTGSEGGSGLILP